MFKKSILSTFVLAATAGLLVSGPLPPEGFTALFNGKDLDGWWGLGT